MLRFFRKYAAVLVFFLLVVITVTPTVFAQTQMPTTATSPGVISSFVGSIFSGVKSVFSWGFNLIAPLLHDLLYWLFYLIDTVAVSLAYWMGKLMDYTLYYTVVNFTPTFVEIGGLSTSTTSGQNLIYYAWSIVRDILNTGVFFVVIYHAIRAMFQGFEDIKKKFIGLLVFVILINFSLLFVKVVADISNVAILQLYNAAASPVGSANTTEFFTSSKDNKTTSLSGFVLNAVNPFSFFSEKRINKAIESSVKQNTETALFQLGLIMVHLYLAFLFLYVAAILFVRSATFIIVMIASPLLVAGMFFSGLQEAADKVKSELQEEALQGPGIIFLLILSSLIVSGLFSSTSFSAIPGQENSVLLANLGVFIKFMIFGAFNYYAFSFIRKITTTGSNLSEKLMGLSLGLGFGAVGWGLRRTVGGAANVLYNNDRFGKAWAKTALDENASKQQRFVANAKLKAVNLFRNSSFDGRTGMSMLQKTAVGGRILTSLKTGMPMPKLNVGTGSTKTAASMQAKRDEDENRRRDNWRKTLAETGSSLWSVSDGRLIQEGLVKSEFAGKNHDVRQLHTINGVIDDNATKANIATMIAAGRGSEKIKIGEKDSAVEMTANEWQTAINKDVSSKSDKIAIDTAISGRGEDEEVDITTSTGTSRKKVSEWKEEANSIQKQTIEGAIGEARLQLGDITKREKLVAKYAEKSKGDIEKAFDKMQGKGKISYVAEVPYMAVRKTVRKAVGQQLSGGDSRANMKAADRYENAKKQETKTKIKQSSDAKIAQNIFKAGKSLSSMLQNNTLTFQSGLTTSQQNSINYLKNSAESSSEFVLNYISNPDPTKKKPMDKSILTENLTHLNNVSEAILLHGSNSQANDRFLDSLDKVKESIQKEIEKIEKEEMVKKEQEVKK